MPAPDPMLAGRYRLRSVLGRGGMADVWRADDTVGAREVAVKVFRPSPEPVDAQRRRHEVTMLAAVHHPGVVRLLDADVGDSTTSPGRYAFLVSELVDGPTLRARLVQGPLDEPAVVALGVRLAQALDHVHRRNIVHRDVKPANILLPGGPGCEQDAKLADFGIARSVDDTGFTGEGLTVGTAGYLSPEQVVSGAVNTASDVYSLGLVLIEALTGQVVYPGHGVETALHRLHRQPHLPVGVDPVLGATLRAMTALDPVERPGAGEVAQRLAAVAEPSLVNDILALGTAERAAPRHRRPPQRIWQRGVRRAA